MKFKCIVSPKGMITVGGIVHKANAGYIETQGDEVLEKALEDNHYWEMVSKKDVKEIEKTEKKGAKK